MHVHACAGKLRKKHPGMSEGDAVMTAIIDSCYHRLVQEDVQLFQALVQEVFHHGHRHSAAHAAGGHHKPGTPQGEQGTASPRDHRPAGAHQHLPRPPGSQSRAVHLLLQPHFGAPSLLAEPGAQPGL